MVIKLVSEVSKLVKEDYLPCAEIVICISRKELEDRHSLLKVDFSLRAVDENGNSDLIEVSVVISVEKNAVSILVYY